jgi:(p)ppGpp synthase/HD superfamily hydrolase
VLTVNNNVGINEISANQLFSVYPNPTSTVINLKSDAQLLGVSYFIYDNLGKRILSGKVTSENMPIDLNQLAEGNYLIGIDDNSKKQSFKVIKN